MEQQWISVKENPPKDGQVVMTKIANPDRNEQTLKKSGNLWFYPDGSMYVYYTPTHWMELPTPPTQ